MKWERRMHVVFYALIGVVMLAGCGERKLERVTCSDGFDTGWVIMAYTGYYAPVVRWQDNNGLNHTYSVTKGATCTELAKGVGGD